MTTLTVGSGEEFSTLSAAVAASHNGDVIEVKAGTYVNDFATVTDSITIESVGGMANFVATEPPTNLKAILTVGQSTASNIDVTVKGLSFSGAAISAADGANAAGIKEQSGHLTVDDCLFHNNQMGILTGNIASSSITVINSEFAGQSTLPGYLAHQLYVGQIGSAVIENNLFLANDSGHQIKDRAATSLIENNVIDDGSGHTSYDIDLPNGGSATISGNQIIKGTNDPNTTVISYGEEGMIWGTNSLAVTGNTIDNKLAGTHGIGVHNYSSVIANIENNQFYHLPTVAVGPNVQSGNVTLTSEPVIVDRIPAQTQSTTAQAPILSVSSGSGNENAQIPLTIKATQAASNLSPSDLSVTISGLNGATLNHGVLNTDGSYTLSDSDLTGLALTPTKGFVGTLALHVTATDSEPSSHTSASSAPATLDVVVNRIAEAPHLSVQAATGPENHAIPLAISATQAASTLPSSDLTLTIANLDGATLNHGTHNADGSYTLHSTDLAGLALDPAKGFVGTIALHVTATDTEASSHTTASSAAETLDVTVSASSSGTPAPPSGSSVPPLQVISADGTSLKAGSSGHLVTSDGTWTFSSKTSPGGHLVLLNGAPAANGTANLLIVEHGHLYADNSQGHWYEWTNSHWASTTDPVPHATAPTYLAPVFSDKAGHEPFVLNTVLQSPAHIADFSGHDLLDLAPALKAAGYTGTNPLSDHTITFDPAGTSTNVDLHIGGHEHTLVTLDHVAPHNVHAANIWA